MKMEELLSRLTHFLFKCHPLLKKSCKLLPDLRKFAGNLKPYRSQKCSSGIPGMVIVSELEILAMLI